MTESCERDAASLVGSWHVGRGARIRPLVRSGFSGATLWLVEAMDGGRYVLKPFPIGASGERAAWLHTLVLHVTRSGGPPVPEPAVAVAGGTVVTDGGGRPWELAGLLPGEAVDAPSPAQATAAVEALARFHLAAATFPAARPTVAPSAGAVGRIDRARRLLAHSWPRRLAAARGLFQGDSTDSPRAAVVCRWERAVEIIEHHRGERLLTAIAAARPPAVPAQAVMRDVWGDHVLFERHREASIGGFVDLHAAGIDTVAADLARLLGSWRPPHGRLDPSLCERWREQLTAYERWRPLSGGERGLIDFLHAGGIVGGLDNWFRWVVEEGRAFPAHGRLLDRIDRLLAELPAVCATVGDGKVSPV